MFDIWSINVFLIGMIVGIVIGFIIYALRFYRLPVGVIVVDVSEPDNDPYLYLNISKDDLYNIINKKVVTLEVNRITTSDSQK